MGATLDACARGGTVVLIRPTAGLDYDVNDVPLNFSFDWRPVFVVTPGTDFSAPMVGFIKW